MHLAHDVADEGVDTAGRDHFAATETAEEHVAVGLCRKSEAILTGPQMLEQLGIVSTRHEPGAEEFAVHDRSLHSWAYSGYRF
jgi:hypothetical protein